MNQERLKVLTMLSEGKINTDEAESLLDLLVNPETDQRPPQSMAPESSGANLDQLAQFKIHGVTPNFIQEMQTLGFDLLPDKLVEFKIHGVKPDFIREMIEAGFEDLSPEKLIELKIHGMDPNFVKEMKDLESGEFADFTKEMGDFAEEMKDFGQEMKGFDQEMKDFGREMKDLKFEDFANTTKKKKKS